MSIPPSGVASKATVAVGSLFQVGKVQSKFKYYAAIDYNEEELPPYPAGEWMKLEPRQSLQMYELDEDEGLTTVKEGTRTIQKHLTVVSEYKDKRTSTQQHSTVVNDKKDKTTETQQHSTVVGENKDNRTSTQLHLTIVSESKDKTATVVSESRTSTAVSLTGQGTIIESESKDEEDAEERSRKKEEFYELDDNRIKRVNILRGPTWNYGVRKISEDVEYYNHVIFGIPWPHLKTPDDMILRGTTWIPSKTITSSMARFIMRIFKDLGHDKTALVEVETGRSLTYGEMADKVESLACGLHMLGVEKNQVLAIVSYHSLEAHLMLLACILVGAVAALVDSSLNAVELGIALRITSPNFVFTEPGKTLHKVQTAINYLELSLHNPNPVIIINSTTIAPSDEYFLFIELLKEVNPLESIPGPHKADPLRPVLILFTGTGDNLKACLISERYFTHSMAFVESVLPKSDEPSITVMVTPPMWWPLAIKTVFNHYVDGHRIILCRGPVPDPCLITALRQFEVFAILTLRSTLMSLLDWPAPPRCPHLKLVAVTGSPLRMKNLQRVHDQLFKNKVQILQLYGLVETGTAAANTFLENKQGSVGKLFFNVEMKVLEEGTGRPLGPNHEGELCVRSPTMMLGYYNNSAANKDTIDVEGFVHTGDLGYYDEDGFVHVTDQVREMIKYRTYLVSPSLVEEVLIELPEIKEALVFGLLDEEDGELVSAAIILEFGYEDTDVLVLLRQANALLPDRRKIRGGIYIFNQFPRSTIGKPIREQILKEVMMRKSQRRRLTE